MYVHCVDSSTPRDTWLWPVYHCKNTQLCMLGTMASYGNRVRVVLTTKYYPTLKYMQHACVSIAYKFHRKICSY